jgi:hypothetical protein
MQDHGAVPHGAMQYNHDAVPHGAIQKRSYCKKNPDLVYFVLKFLKRVNYSYFLDFFYRLLASFSIGADGLF